ncbi:hypothetical protein ENKNEFLB_04131 [Nocardioides aquaticus]|uniref:Uncharacterized protein n=1 Tax=Nocardioides aquaticus TaxID=160826 RepID=A0ABX8EMG3_9ACTN|nr:hypothetical protein [Nocardioides aquaticus]QVT81714.1 hypothetical protein ENKNEFLB_04131 [Nocardioides aquaticus]
MPPAPTAARSRLLGIALGVLGLAALVVLAVVLPRLDGAEASPVPAEAMSSEDAVEVSLPASVPGFALVEAGDDAAAEQLTERLDSAEQLLEQTYEVPVTVGLYNGSGGEQDQRTAVVTAASAPAGLFLPSGPAPAPDLVGLARNQAELVRVGDTICNVVYGAPVAQGEQVDDSVPPSGVQCQQTADDGVTFQVDGTAMSASEASGLLDALTAAQDQ